MRAILVGLFFISVLTGCRKNVHEPSYVTSPPSFVDNAPKAPTYQTTNDSIITMIQFVEDFPINRERDTFGNSTWDRSLPLLVFWTKGNKRYLYRKAPFGDENVYLADYTGNYDLLDTLQPPLPLTDDWADWERAYPINKRVLDSSVFTLQVSLNMLHKMYLSPETKFIAPSLSSSPMFIGRWINSVFKRIRGQKYKLTTVVDTVSLKDNIIKRVTLEPNRHINNGSDTAGNYVSRIFLETESGKRFVFGSYSDSLGRYKAYYVGKEDLINVHADTLIKPISMEDSWALYQINLSVIDTVGFVVHTKEANIRKLYLSNRTTISAEIQNMPIKIMARWYNMALNRLRGGRFFYAYYGD